MKISIVTEGFHNTGYGHITRCLSLYQAFEARNIYPTLYVHGDEACKSFLSNSRYEIFDWLKEPELLFEKIGNSDIIIVDSYSADKSFYDRIALLTSLPVYIDDTLRLEYPSGTILNGAINAESLNYAALGSRTTLLGSKYIPIRKEFWEVPEKLVKIEIQTVILTFGGQDLRNLTPRILRALVRNYPEWKKIVVVGSGFDNVKQIEETKDDLTEIYHSPSAGEMVKLMLDSDLAISAAGQTIYELARIGVPTIAINVADNQAFHLRGWIKEGFIASEISYKDINLEHKIFSTMNNTKKRAIREKLIKLGKQKVDGEGARRVIQNLIDQASGNYGFYLRRANEKDSLLVFNLSNDRVVRINSINQRPIKLNEHSEWFIEKLINETCVFFLAFNKADSFIGQVRFDISQENALINISIDKDFRGKHFAAPLIFISSFRLLKERKEVNTISAYIRPQNIPSVKAFSKAGYLQAADEIKNDERYLVYKLVRQ
jgi:spore coat polysaccharide biosynthesis predicted glycosyltransferase SpsG/RimJ/RimL family protein N-acetyltransferase